jgi:hypothetical protein
MHVFKGFPLGHHGDAAVFAPMDGFLRGIARDGAFAPAGVKLIEVDPRGRSAAWTGSDQRGRAIAEAVIKAIRVRGKLRKGAGAGRPILGVISASAEPAASAASYGTGPCHRTWPPNMALVDS